MTKRLLLNLLLLVFSAISVNAYKVSTEPQNKNVLIEDFSGIYCGHCYEAADLIEAISRNHPQVSAITMHAGDWAKPGPSDKDLRCVESLEIDQYFGEKGYPSGTVNRLEYDGEILSSRATWTEQTCIYTGEQAVVNLYATAVGDQATREMKVHVEGYYTGEPESSENYLCVALIQSDILSFQKGTEEGNNYPEQNVLRGYLSNVWGDPINAAKGGYFEKDYTYTVPEKHYPLEDAGQASDYVLKDLELVIFVLGKDHLDVLNVMTIRPDFGKLEAPFAFKLKKPQIAVPQRYGFNFFEAQLCNKSLEEATSATFDVEVNGKTYTGTWTGSIAAQSNADIRILMPSNFQIEDNSDYHISLSTVNGKSAICNDILEGLYSAPIDITNTISWIVKTDNALGDQLFCIRDADGNIVEEIGPLTPDTATTYKGTTTLEKGKTYCFEAYNPWGNGINNGKTGTKTKSGEFQIMDAYGDIQVQVFKITFYGTRAFFTTSIDSAVEGIAEDSAPAQYYNLQGVQIEASSLNHGVFIEKRGTQARLIKR